MPKRPKDLFAFREWLRCEWLLSPNTITTYCSHVRYILKATGGIQQIDAHMLAVVLSEVSDSSRTGYRTAWRRFYAFGRSKGVTLPDVPDAGWGRRSRRIQEAKDATTTDAPPLDPMVLSVLRDAKDQGVTAYIVANSTWGQIRLSSALDFPGLGPCHMLRDPDQLRQHYPLPKDTVSVLLAWAVGPDGEGPLPDLPLVPKEAKSMEPYPFFHLRRRLL